MNRVEHANWGDSNRVAFYCPGCGELHAVPVDGPKAWGWNGSTESPTLTPSLLVRGTKTECDPGVKISTEAIEAGTVRSVPYVCHSFVRDGRIQFLTDCTHDKAGQTIDLPELTEPIA